MVNQINPPQNVVDYLQTILDAIATGNYELFLTVGDAEYKAGITKDMFDSVSSNLIPRMSEGYTINYFGQLKQREYQTYLWKLSFSDGGDEFVVRMAVNESKVGGISIT